MNEVGVTAGIESESDLGQYLVRLGKLRAVDLNRVKRVQNEQGNTQRLARLLVKLGVVGERDVGEAIAAMSGMTLVAQDEYPTESVLSGLLAPRFMLENHIIPLADSESGVTVAMADPLDDSAREALTYACGRPVVMRVGLPSEIEAAIKRLAGENGSTLDPVVEGEESGAGLDSEDIEHLKDLASEAPVIRVVNLIIERATESGASDIHVEPFEGQLKVRYRIDGVLRETEPPPVQMGAAIVSRIKIMARLDIAERRIPQDGRIRLRLRGKDFDLRISTIPTMYGESVVLRLLNRESIDHDFTALGFPDDARKRFEQVLKLPHGMILLTGPTGSGKTTTLYAALSLLNTPERKIITVEDPVEYQLEGINQIQAKPSIGLSFANTLRSIVRQDPDVIMVGEMRDLETARISIQSALTGHLVLSTLHTNDAASSTTRLLEMGVEDYLLTSTLNAVVAQRLVRVLCPHCRRPSELPDQLAALLDRMPERERGDGVVYTAGGCARCGGSGYNGRTAIHELMVIDDDIRRLILKHEETKSIEEAACANGMRTMYEAGMSKVAAGVTSLEEVLRVTEET
ncbi:type II secretion system ATPase GspE [Sedimenticola selenatireducens]|uniref:type II secretion system ATPase GspE n=1 Tax=Sedimenticola selenatireducens TaxID=191960 RepID=UPI002AABC068|nr:type II secretion system ATPase GspE [Sedimenticola selenatireducens]